MPKKLIFGIILAFIGMTGLQFDASADNYECILNKDESGKANNNPGKAPTCPGNLFPVSCTAACATGTCTVWTIKGQSSAGTYSACSCDTCNKGSYRFKFEKGAARVADICGSTLSVSLYSCEPCGLGKYSEGETAESCTSCPENTYGGGGDYNSCKPCPANATCNGGADFTCDEKYYKDGDGCTQCPPADGVYTDKSLTTKAQYTSAAGATSKNDCYLQSGEQYYDSRGGFMFADICY